MSKVVIIFSLLILFLDLEAQTQPAVQSDKPNREESKSLILLTKENTNSLTNTLEETADIRSEIEFHTYTKNIFTNPPKTVEKPSFNIVSSFRSNIRWGGFWENYAIVNFTPDMFIQPFDFVSIYANHNTSTYVPIKSIKENIKPLLVRSIAILAIDNSIKFILPSNKLIQAIANFALKSLVINYLKTPTINNQSIEFKHYYYSVSIKFNHSAFFQ